MPTRTPGRLADLIAFATHLREHPGRELPHPHHPAAAKSAASRIRNGHTAAFGEGFRARVHDGTVLVAYAPR